MTLTQMMEQIKKLLLPLTLHAIQVLSLNLPPHLLPQAFQGSLLFMPIGLIMIVHLMLRDEPLSNMYPQAILLLRYLLKLKAQGWELPDRGFLLI